MPFRVGDIVKYRHPSSDADEEQLDLYHYGKDHLDGKIALVLEMSVSATVDTCDYFCFIDGDRMWINEAVLYEVEENENKKNNS
jgi:hypothetical protein